MKRRFVNCFGQCFICLERVIRQSNELAGALSYRNTSNFRPFQYAAHYLGLSEKDFIPPRHSETVTVEKDSELMVELCDGCADNIESMQALYQLQERVRMELTLTVKKTHEIMINANRSSLLENLRKFAEESPSDLEMVQTIENARLKAIMKCSSRLQTASPRVVIKKLESENTPAPMDRIESQSDGGKLIADPLIKGGIIDVATPSFLVSPASTESSRSSARIQMRKSQKRRKSDDDFIWEYDTKVSPEPPILIRAKAASSDDNILENAAGTRSGISIFFQKINMATLPITEFQLPASIMKMVQTAPPKVNVKVQCNLCRKVICKKSLKKHLRVVHHQQDQKKWICDICPKIFDSKVYLMRHKIQIHQENCTGAAKCLKCNKTFSGPLGLNRHKRFNKICTENKIRGKTPCRICGKLIHVATMKRHINSVHLRVREICDVCKKSFSQLHELKVHKKIEHGIGNVTVYRCNKCKTHFTRRMLLLKHQKPGKPCAVFIKNVRSSTEN